MTDWQKKSLFFLRIALGWLFFYAGVSKLMNPAWTAAGYLKGAQTLTPLYQWLASPENIGWVNTLNMWGLTLVGAALILGIFVRPAAFFGILLMILYYIPVLDFPKVGTNSFIIDDHIIYIAVFIVLKKFDAGAYFGLKDRVKKLLPKQLTNYA